MATRESIAIREHVAREAIQVAIRDIGAALGLVLTPRPLERSSDPAYRAMNELEQLADLLVQVSTALHQPVDRGSDMPEVEPAIADESLAESLEALTVKQLQDLATTRGVAFDTKARKAELVAALLASSEEREA